MSRTMIPDDAGKSLVRLLLGSGPYVVTVTAFAVTLVALLSLLVVDVYVGESVFRYLSANDKIFSWAASFATTGVLTLFLGLAWKGIEKGWQNWKVWGLVIAAGSVVIFDTCMDGMSLDLKRFGSFVVVSQTLGNQAEILMHWAGRILIGLISLLGEPLTALAIVAFPALQDLFERAVELSDKVNKSLTPQRGPGIRPAPSPSVKPGAALRLPPTRPPASSPGTIVSRPLYNEPTFHPVGMPKRNENS